MDNDEKEYLKKRIVNEIDLLISVMSNINEIVDLVGNLPIFQMESY